MASNVVFFCKECGYESAKWMGKCPGCNSWNSFVEEKVNKKATKSGSSRDTFSQRSEVKKLKDIVVTQEVRLDTGYEELNKVFGGGIVEGSLNLIGGEPGIGKSTLIMQVCSKLADIGNVLYISGEESETQVKLRADRLGVKSDNILFLIFFNIAQIGVIAGPRILEHMVDTVIYIEGERFLSHRIVRGVKNRFGSTNEIGVFDMKDEGMVEVKNLSDIFLTKSDKNLPGTAIVATVEGTSTILMEVQALTTHSYYNNPRRVPNGIDLNRLNMLIAVLEKRCNLSLSTQDIYVNIIGGMRVDEPAVDLSVAMAIVSSYKNITIDPKTVFLGEIGLTGEIRNITNFEKRIKEITKLGYNTIYTNKKQIDSLKEKVDANLIGVSTIDEVIDKIVRS